MGDVISRDKTMADGSNLWIVVSIETINMIKQFKL